MESTTAFSLAPSVGARVGFWRQLGLRADAGDVVTFRGDTRHNLQLTAGLSFPFLSRNRRRSRSSAPGSHGPTRDQSQPGRIMGTVGPTLGMEASAL